MNVKTITERLDTAFVPEREKYTVHLREMIACRTISEEKYYDKAEFDKLEAVLEKNYPHVFEKCEKIELCGSTFLRIPGERSASPLVLMSHQDVVSEGKKKWKAPAFGGGVIRGKMYGRGTFDCKGSLCALFEAAESLLEQGVFLKNDLYIFASSTEETAGPDAPAAVEYFRSAGIVPGLVIDEGGAVLRNPFPSSYKRFAMIGAVERSSGRILYNGESAKKVKEFAKKVKKLRPGVYETVPETAGLIHGLAGYLRAPLGSLLGVLDRHPGAAKNILTHCGADARSFCGAITDAVILSEEEKKEQEEKHGTLDHPVRVSVSGNFYNKIDALADEVKKLAAAYGMKLVWEYIRETEKPVSPESAGYRFVSDVAAAVFDNIGVLPYPVLGRTDARYFIGYAEDVIRFIPVEISLAQMMKFHCPNENICVESLPGAVAFYREAILQYMK